MNTDPTRRILRLVGALLALAWVLPGQAAQVAADPEAAAATATEASDADDPDESQAPAEDPKGHGNTAKGLQNPLSDLIILPFQNITNRGFDRGSGVQNTLNIQPVVPVRLNQKWKLLLRPILPVMDFSWPQHDSGIGDFQFEPFLSPNLSGSVQWGVGGVFSFPTASNDALGFGKYTAGPSFALFAGRGRWTFSMIATQQWSYAGDDDRDDVSLFTLQPSLNYNMKNGWYLIFGPLVSADWTAESGQKWIIPVGGGLGKVFSIGKQKMSLSLENYWNIERPDAGPETTTILTFSMIFRE